YLLATPLFHTILSRRGFILYTCDGSIKTPPFKSASIGFYDKPVPYGNDLIERCRLCSLQAECEHL
ncbi:MAG TPA: hypothetical protein PKX20_00935, partial [Methanothrix soehngenii]|nr:hypothetical protein [Methanothrix soehngenii]